MNNLRQFSARRRRGMTLTELLLGLTVLSILSVGATYLVTGALKTDRLLLDTDRQVSEVEFSLRRLIHNIRTGSALTLTGTTTLSLTTQADPSNNGQTYVVTYTYNAAAGTLTESSTQYGASPTANVIAYNVSAFSVTQTTSPTVVTIDITLGGTATEPATRRTFRVWNRNS